MITVILNPNKSIEQGIKYFSNRVKATHLLNHIKEHNQYTKPSTNRRRELEKAKYIQKLKNQEDM